MRLALPVAALLAASIALTAPAQVPTAGEKAVMTEIVRLDGKADVDEKLAASARVVAEFETGTDALLAKLTKHPEIGGVKLLDATKCSDKGFAALKELPNLRKLVLGKAALSPAAAAAIGQCKNLRYLGVVGCGVSDADVAALKDLVLLEHLSLSENPQVTDKSMAVVKGFDRLRVLYLSKTAITDKGLAELKGLDGLRTLNVKSTKVTADAAEKFVEGMPNLRTVAQ